MDAQTTCVGACFADENRLRVITCIWSVLVGISLDIKEFRVGAGGHSGPPLRRGFAVNHEVRIRGRGVGGAACLVEAGGINDRGNKPNGHKTKHPIPAIAGTKHPAGAGDHPGRLGDGRNRTCREATAFGTQDQFRKHGRAQRPAPTWRICKRTRRENIQNQRRCEATYISTFGTAASNRTVVGCCG